jgi:endonuclease G
MSPPLRGLVYVFLLWAALSLVPTGWAKLGVEYQTALGYPTDSTTDPLNRTDYLLERSQYTLSYNDDTRQANWVSWSYTTTDSGAQARTDAWSEELDLPAGYLRIGIAAFGTGWDRGHMTPSADRTLSLIDNQLTFRMSNIIPQASNNNRGPWAQFEDYSRSMASDGSEVLIISGPSEFEGEFLPNGMAVPVSIWKIAVKVDAGPGSAASRLDFDSRVIALITPNVNVGLGTWQSYITSVEEIEAITGYDFFSEADPSVAIYLKNVVDTGSGPNTPTVITSFSPSVGGPGTTVTIHGHNFGATPVVKFNGTSAFYSVNGNGTQITATVPSGATPGPITVQGTGGTDESLEHFQALASNDPLLWTSAPAIDGLETFPGSPGTAKTYLLNGTNLSGNVTLTAPAGVEISQDGTTFFSSLTLAPSGSGLSGLSIRVRLAASAPLGAVSGNITHSGGGATMINVAASGTVLSSNPTLSVSSAGVTGLLAVEGFSGFSKSYTLSGYNLAGTVTLSSSGPFELSFDNTNFNTSLSLTPSGNSLPSTVVYVRLAASAPIGAASGNITHSGGGATSQVLPVSGTVFTSGTSETSEVLWNFETPDPTSGVGETFTTSNVTQVNNNGASPAMISASSTSSGYAGASGGNNAVASAKGGNFTTNSTCFEFTITPDADYLSAITNISFGIRSTTSGPLNYTVRTSLDSYAADLGSESISNNSTWFLKTHAITGVSSESPITIRIYSYGGTGSSGASNWRIDDLRVTVASTSTLAAPVISATSATATAYVPFTYTINASESPTSYGATGLPPGLSINSTTGVISGTTTATGNFPVILSATNAGGEGTQVLSLSVSANAGAPTITGNLTASALVRTAFSYQVNATNSPTAFLASNLPAGLSINSATGLISGTPTTAGIQNATLTVQNALGTDSRVLSFSILNPTLTLSPSSLSSFTANLTTAGPTQTYTLTGSQLVANVSVTAPLDFEISTDGTNFSQNLTLSPVSGNLSANLSVRLNDQAALGEVSGTLIHASSGALPKYIPIGGNVSVSDPTLTLSTGSLEVFEAVEGYPSFMQTYTVAGAGLSGNVTITAPAGFELSLNEEDYSGSLILVPGNGTLAATIIDVRIADSASAGSLSGNITHSTPGVSVVSVSINGTVTVPAPPVILSNLSGSSYQNAFFRHTISVDDPERVTEYSATGLPTGLAINTATGVISGTPTAAGNSTIVLRATNPDGNSTANYTLSVLSQAQQDAIPLNVTINKFVNNGASNDAVELLVVAGGTPAQTVDLRGMILKDFASAMSGDAGGKVVFKNHALWTAVPAGTLIVVTAGTSAAEDFDDSDFVLRINLGNTTYFNTSEGGFDLTSTDMVLIKAANTGVEGIAGGMHALAAGSPGSQYTAFTGKKINAALPLAGNSTIGFIPNSNSTLADFYTPSTASTGEGLATGTGNTPQNSTFINTLRGVDQTPPVITLIGANPLTIAHNGNYTEPSATASDAVDGNRTVTITGLVNTAVIGNYTITYTASDTIGNSASLQRTVRVTDQTPPVLTLAGVSPMILAPGDPFTDAGATALDAVDGAVSVFTTGSVNTTVAGAYTLTYTATDAAGNSASIQRQVPVVNQNTTARAFTNTTLTLRDEFTGFNGTASPSEWTLSNQAGAESSSWQGTDAGSSTTGGLRSYGSGDGSLGFLPTGSMAITASTTFFNLTGETVEELQISYTAEQWRAALAGRTNGWTAQITVNGTTSTISSLAFTSNNSTATGAISGGTSTTLNATLTGLIIPHGAGFTLRFVGNNGPGIGSRQGVAIDNLEVAVVAPRLVNISTSPTASTITYGQTLASSALSGGSASVNGSFAFTNPSTVPAPGFSSQGVTFTPANLATHSARILSVSVGVLSLPPVPLPARNPGASGFEIEVPPALGAVTTDLRHSASKNMTGAVLNSGISRNHTITMVGPGLRFVQVRSVNAVGNGSWSDVLAKQLILIPATSTRYLSLPFTPGGNQTVAGIFGSTNEAGLTAGGNSSVATNVLLLNSNGQTANFIFYNSSASQWREGPTDQGALSIPQGNGFMLKNPTATDDYLVLTGTPRASGGPPVTISITTDPGEFQLVSPTRSTATRLADLNLNPGPGLGQFKTANLVRNADRIFVPNSEGALIRYHHDGTNWKQGPSIANDITVPVGGSFFILKATGSTFQSWVLPAEAP